MYPADEIRRFIERRLLEDRKLCEFTEGLIDGVKEHQARIDTMISQVAENWRLDRMAAIDRNILRLGAYEMLFRPEVPAKVAINEALELAKRYSTAQSSRFVNGILDRVLQCQIQEASSRRLNAEASQEPAAEPEPAIASRTSRRMKPNPRRALRRLGHHPAWHRRDGADLHVHTTHSDGACSPCEVVVAAAQSRPGGTGHHRP